MSSPGDIGLHSPETTGTVNANEDTTWEPNPLPLMVKHPPRVTASNTKIQLDRAGALSQVCPKGEDDLGWVQVQQKSLLWQEMIEGSLVVTHEGLTTMTQSSRTGWTVMSGTWNHLRSKASYRSVSGLTGTGSSR